MASSRRDLNRPRLDTGLDLAGSGLLPFLQAEMDRAYGSSWREVATGVLQHRGPVANRDGVPDLYNLLYLMSSPGVWRKAFSLGPLANRRHVVVELQDVRNLHAHNQHSYDNADTYRDLDTITRVLKRIGAPESARTWWLRHEVLMDLYVEENEKLSDKKEEVLSFLTNHVFRPVLDSSAPTDVKRRVHETMDILQAKETAREIIEFYWTAIMNSTDLPRRMKEAGMVRFEEVIEEFRTRFDDQWLAE